MSKLQDRILHLLASKSYQPLKVRALARKLGVAAAEYQHFKSVLRLLARQGRIEVGKNHTIRQAQPHGTITGVFRRTGSGFGFVRPHVMEGKQGPEVFIPEGLTLDASTGDEVLVRLKRRSSRGDLATGQIIEVLERATRQFVGTYFERDGQGLVRVDGSVFSHSIYVGDPGAKGVRSEDKVVIEMLRFPGPEDRGEAVITEILGKHGQPGVDTLSVIRAFGLPDEFPADVLEEARAVAAAFNDKDLDDREDFTGDVVITIDPRDARDHDDAVSVGRDPETGHWHLAVHIADVSYFVPPGSLLDREARKRGTSVYLPQKVLPMFPEILSNGLASLQEGKRRYVKSVLIDFTPEGAVTATRFVNGVICVRKRFTYEQVFALLQQLDRSTEGGGKAKAKATSSRKKKSESPSWDLTPADVDPAVLAMLGPMRELALILRERRIKRGALELNVPEPELEYDADGKVCGAHFRRHDISHQIIEEFMLAANETVASHLSNLGVPFLRRVHPAPDPHKLRAFADFARILGYKIHHETDRFALQRILQQSAENPDVHAVHYALLRSLKQAVYSPEAEGHYALASEDYCHFTSPIRRYPDVQVHRLLGQWLRTGKAGADEAELAALGEHCSKMERRADAAERELIKVRLLDYMNERIGMHLDAIITGVADYGFYAQAEQLPVEGLVSINSLTDDYYYFDEMSHSLTGKKHKRRYRLGDKVRVEVARVELQRRLLDFRIAGRKK